MPAKSSAPEIPLPRSWPSRVKSAILHVTNLGRSSLAHTRGWAANSPSRQFRLEAEVDRDCQEIIGFETRRVVVSDAREHAKCNNLQTPASQIFTPELPASLCRTEPGERVRVPGGASRHNAQMWFRADRTGLMKASGVVRLMALRNGSWETRPSA